MNHARQMGPVDAIWLNMDRPNNLMMIDSLLFLDGPVDIERLMGVYRRRLVERHPVFRQRPVPPRTPGALPGWESDPEFRLSRHVKRARLPEPGDDGALQRFVEGRMSVPLSRNHPLWEVHVVEGFGEGTAVYSRLHHALADGIALTQVMLSLTDETPTGDLRWSGPPGLRPPRREPDGVAELALRAAVAAGTAIGAITAGARRPQGWLASVADPRRAVDVVGQVTRTGRTVNKLLLSHNPPTALSGPPGVEKRAVWSDAYPLDDLKRVGHLAGATLNDVLVSAVAGAIARYLLDQGGEATDLATMVPVNIRPPAAELPPELGNRFALVLFDLPAGITAPLERLAETKRRMDEIKRSPEALLTFGMITAIGRTGADLERYLVDFFADKAIGVTTNVPGPTTPRYLAGTRISGALGWAPGSGNQTLGVCIFTYDGTVRVGFKADADRVREPEKLLHAFEQELGDLVHMATDG